MIYEVVNDNPKFKKLKSEEKLAFSLPVGLGMNAVLMAVLDLTGCKINNLSIKIIIMLRLSQQNK